METRVQIHEDYCTNMSSADIQAILTQITAVITEAILRGLAVPETGKEAA